nr:hypothetical protein [Tanacetum cinerariifolium]
MQTQTSNTLHNAIMEAGGKDRLPMLAPDREVIISEGSSVTTTETYMETYKNVSQDIRDQLNAEAEAVQIILTWIDNDIYSTVDACPNACEMWKAIERFYKMMNELIRNQCDVTIHKVNVQFLLQLQPEWQRFVTLVKQSQELKTVSYHKLYDILKQHQNEVNELRAERIARTANPLALVAQQQPVYHTQNHPTHYTQNSSTRSQQAATRNREKAIVNSLSPIYDQESSMVAEDDEMLKDKEIDKLMALISLSFKKIYKPTNNNLRTTSNTSRANQDNSLRINKDVGYDNQRLGNVAGARETVGTPMVQKSRIQCYNYKEFRHIAREYATDSGPIFDTEPVQKVSNNDNYNVFAIKSEHPEQSESIHDTYPIEQDEHNVIIVSLDMSYDREQIDQNDDDNDFSNDYKELDKVIALENKVKVLDNIVYKTGQSVQTMNMLNGKCRTSFEKPEFLKKAQRANPRLYDIGCYNDNLALMLAPESDEAIRLEKESRSKLNDLTRPFNYEKLNNLYDLFVPQRKKSSKQRYFSERSRLSHTPTNNGNSKKSFNKQTTLLEKRMDESISWDQKCKISKELFKIKISVGTIFDGVERCKETIAKQTYFGHIDPFIQNTIEANFYPEIRKINADLEKFHLCLNEKMVADLRYFNSLELE